MRLQDWLNSGDEFSTAFKVNYISEDLLPITVTSRLLFFVLQAFKQHMQKLTIYENKASAEVSDNMEQLMGERKVYKVSSPLIKSEYQFH